MAEKVAAENVSGAVGVADQEDPAFRTAVLAWARGPREQADWVRRRRPLGINAGRYILGQVIAMVITDDIGCFSQARKEAGEIDKLDITLDRDCLLERLDWESSIPNVPDDLKDRIKAFKKTVEIGPWNNVQIEKQFFVSWEEQIQNFVRGKLRNDPSYIEANDYFEENKGKINSLYFQAKNNPPAPVPAAK